MRLRQWIELLKKYDCTIEYHPVKANVVADALSRKSYSNLTHMKSVQFSLFMELQAMNVDMKLNSQGELLATLKVRPILVERVKEAQTGDA